MIHLQDDPEDDEVDTDCSANSETTAWANALIASHDHDFRFPGIYPMIIDPECSTRAFALTDTKADIWARKRVGHGVHMHN